MGEAFRAFQFRLYLNAEQRRRLQGWAGALRWLWNIAHEQRLLGWSRGRGEKRFPKFAAQSSEATELRSALPWLADTPRRSCDRVLRILDLSWRKALSRKGGIPRFKSKRRPSQAIPLDERSSFCVGSGALRLGKLGEVRCRGGRESLPGRTVRVEIVEDLGEFRAIFHQAIEVTAPPRRSGVVGIDRGIGALVADSDGASIANPRFAARAQRRLRRLQRALARAKKGSKNRAKARLRLARAHRKVRRQRAWLQHQISHDYAKSHGVVVIEKLETARMSRSARGTVDTPGRNVSQKAGLNRSILDAGWAGLARMLKYKLEERGGELVEVPAAYSSQTCSACGVVDAASRRTQAEFCCVACGHSLNADVNAARVILSRWSPPVQPVEACDGAA